MFGAISEARRGEAISAYWHCTMLAGVMAGGIASPVAAQTGDYPSKTVQIIANSAAGSTPDVALRFVAEGLAKSWGQQVIVVNRPGARGSVGARAAAEAAPSPRDFGRNRIIADIQAAIALSS